MQIGFLVEKIRDILEVSIDVYMRNEIFSPTLRQSIRSPQTPKNFSKRHFEIFPREKNGKKSFEKKSYLNHDMKKIQVVSVLEPI